MNFTFEPKENDMMHYAAGTQKPGAKYISRKKVNGKWRYTYAKNKNRLKDGISDSKSEIKDIRKNRSKMEKLQKKGNVDSYYIDEQNSRYGLKNLSLNQRKIDRQTEELKQLNLRNKQKKAEQSKLKKEINATNKEINTIKKNRNKMDKLQNKGNMDSYYIDEQNSRYGLKNLSTQQRKSSRKKEQLNKSKYSK